jgi:hypothetical protein
VLDLVRGTFGPEWKLSATVASTDPAPPGYAVNFILTKGGQQMTIGLLVRVQAPGDPGCAAGAAASGAQAGTCVVQPEGDALLVGSHEVMDMRRDGTVVTVTGTTPATVAQLTTLARSPKVGVAN